jgi:hypothetical protein
MTGDPTFADYAEGGNGADKAVLMEMWNEANAMCRRLEDVRDGKIDPKVLVYETWATRTARNLLEDETPPPASIIDKLLLAATLLVIAGPPKVGKTWLALLLALCLVTGKPFLGFDVPERRRVLFLGGEGNDPHLKKRLMAAIAFFPGIEEPDLDNLKIVSTQGKVKFDEALGASTVKRWADEADVLIADPTFRFQASGDENSHRDARVVQDYLDSLKAAGKTIVAVHHTRKPGAIDAGVSEIRGAGWDAFCDSALILRRKKGGASERFILEFDLRHDESPDDMELTREGPLFIPAEPAERIVTASDVVRVIEEAGGRVEGQKALIEALGRHTNGASERTCRRAIREAEDSERIWSAKRAGVGQGRVYLLKEDA